MARWFAMTPCDETYFDTAPYVYRFPMTLPVPPERVWAGLVAPNSVADWTPLLKRIEWTSDLGLGATRTVTLPLGAATIREYFFRWEEGHRFSFYGTESNRPLFGRLAEDYLVEPDGSGNTRFTWTFAMEGNRGSRFAMPLLDPGNKQLFKRMAHGAEGYFAQHG